MANPRKSVMPVVAAIAGAVLIAAGTVALNVPSAVGYNWSNDQAEQYAKASAAYHRAQSAVASGGRNEQELIAARTAFDSIRRELDAARAGPRTTAYWLMAGGGLLIVASVAQSWRHAAKS